MKGPPIKTDGTQGGIQTHVPRPAALRTQPMRRDADLGGVGSARVLIGSFTLVKLLGPTWTSRLVGRLEI
jgi:hypothetical protein